MTNAPMVYEVRKPASFSPDKTYPALFLMHGIGSNEQNMFSLVDGLEDSFIIFSIRGHLPQSPGFAYFTIQGFGKPDRDVFDEATRRLASFIDYACETYPIDRERLYLLGFSQGAILAMTLSLILGKRIRGIVALSGYIPGFVKESYPVKPVGHLSAFISHGDMDNILPYEWGTANADFFKKLGASVDFHTYHAGHTVSAKNLQDFQRWLLDDITDKQKNN